MMGNASDGRTSRIGANGARVAANLSAPRDIAASRAAEATVGAAWPCDARARGGGRTAAGGPLADRPGALHRRSKRLRKQRDGRRAGGKANAATYLLTRGVGGSASKSFHASRTSVRTAGPGARGPSTKSRISASKAASAGKAAMPTVAIGGSASFHASLKCASTAGPGARCPSTSSRKAASKAASAGKAAMPPQVSREKDPKIRRISWIHMFCL
jgi:hypothetical protein